MSDPKFGRHFLSLEGNVLPVALFIARLIPFNLFLPYAFFSACVLFIYIRQYLEEENPEETGEKLAAVANFIDATDRFK